MVQLIVQMYYYSDHCYYWMNIRLCFVDNCGSHYHDDHDPTDSSYNKIVVDHCDNIAVDHLVGVALVVTTETVVDNFQSCSLNCSSNDVREIYLICYSNGNHCFLHCNFDCSFHRLIVVDYCSYSSMIDFGIDCIVVDQIDDDCNANETNLWNDASHLFRLDSNYGPLKLERSDSFDVTHHGLYVRSKLFADIE